MAFSQICRYQATPNKYSSDSLVTFLALLIIQQRRFQFLVLYFIFSAQHAQKKLVVFLTSAKQSVGEFQHQTSPFFRILFRVGESSIYLIQQVIEQFSKWNIFKVYRKHFPTFSHYGGNSVFSSGNKNMVMLEGAKILFLAPKHIHHRGVGSGSETDFLFDQIWWEQGKFDEEKP